jgi:1-acyl-sn-glycerol-3-phosphate acyltransferase
MRRLLRPIISALLWNHVLGWGWLTYWAERLTAWMVGPERRARGRWAARVSRALWGRALFRTQPFWSVRIHGAAPAGGPQIYCMNHQSLLDVLVTMYAGIDARYISDRRFFRLPLFGGYLRRMNVVPANLSDPFGAAETLDACRELLNEGISIFVFPEGTRSRTGQLGRFRLGAFRLACELGVPVVPLVIDGTRRALPPASWMYPLGAGPIQEFQLRIGEPIEPPNDHRERPAHRLRDRVHREIQTTLADLSQGVARQTDDPPHASVGPGSELPAAMHD